MEKLAIFINQRVYGGRKSAAEGIDLEFDTNGTRYIVSIKSGPNWGNSSQKTKLEAQFTRAKKTLKTSHSKINVEAVNGCCYGKSGKPPKGDYSKYCGQRFWEFISGDKDCFMRIIKPLGHQAKIKNQAFLESYGQMVNRFTMEFANDFCNTDGAIDWEGLVRFNSEETKESVPGGRDCRGCDPGQG